MRASLLGEGRAGGRAGGPCHGAVREAPHDGVARVVRARTVRMRLPVRQVDLRRWIGCHDGPANGGRTGTFYMRETVSRGVSRASRARARANVFINL